MLNVKINSGPIILTAGKRPNSFLKNGVALNGAAVVVITLLAHQTSTTGC